MSEMTKEMEISTARTPSPEMLPGDVVFVEDSITEVGHAMGRYMDPTPVAGEILDPESVASDERIAEILSHVKDDSPKIDPTTEQGVAEATANMIGRAESVIEQATDPIVKQGFEKFKKKNTRGVTSLLTKPVNFGRRKLFKAATIGALALVLASCAPNVIGPVVIPGDGGGVSPTSTETAPVPTKNTAPTPTETATPTPEIIPAFIPEGFSEGPAGLLRNPETGQDTIVFNKEADWKRYKEELIGGLWQANIDWRNFTGRTTDASNFSKEDFIKAAISGKSLKIGIPSRLDTTGKEFADIHTAKAQSNGIVLETQEVRLDNIQIQMVDPEQFKRLTGKDWSAQGQKAFSQSMWPDAKNGAIYFSVSTEGELVVTVGNFDLSSTPIPNEGRDLAIGRFDSLLHTKYPSYFREDGLGVSADKAVSYYTGAPLYWLNNFKTGKQEGIIFTDGVHRKVIFIGMAIDGIDVDSWYTQTPLFKFSQ